MKEGNEAAKVTCEICSYLWAILVFGACTYIVFWMGQSPWWYALAVFLVSGSGCKYLYGEENDKETSE